MITAYALACASDAVRIWIGVFGLEDPSNPTLHVQGRSAMTTVVAPLQPIRDGMTGKSGPINHRTVLEVTGLKPNTTYRITVILGTEHFEYMTRTLPVQLPQKLEGTFNVLLCSCYSQPEDASGLLSTIVSQIKLPPHLTLMMGDQIYGDLPLFEDLPEDDVGLARKLGEKYLRNWAWTHLGSGGLGPVLRRAPVACVADDHEYWNNFPFRQAHLPNTWTAQSRAQWTRIARALYEDYQLAGPAGTTQRINVDPLNILVVDMRSLRDDSFHQLVSASTMHEIKAWANGLQSAKEAGKPAFGMLCSGQALLVAPADDTKRLIEDAEMANYTQFELEIMPVLDGLAQSGIPVIYVTGDVHWGRVAQGIDVRTDRRMLYEVVTSPSRLMRVPITDKGKEISAQIGGLFGKADPWPRHGTPSNVPDRLGEKRHFRLEYDLKNDWGFAQRGDQVAIMSFSKAAGGIDFKVSFYGITADKALSKSCTTRTFELRVS